MLRVFCHKWGRAAAISKNTEFAQAGLPKLPSDLLSYKGWDAMLKDWEGLLPGGGSQQARRLPMILIAGAVIAVVCLLEIGHVTFLQKLEWMTYDARVKLAARHSGAQSNLATNLGLVEITDDTIETVNNGRWDTGTACFGRATFMACLAGTGAARGGGGWVRRGF